MLGAVQPVAGHVELAHLCEGECASEASTSVCVCASEASTSVCVCVRAKRALVCVCVCVCVLMPCVGVFIALCVCFPVLMFIPCAYVYTLCLYLYPVCVLHCAVPCVLLCSCRLLQALALALCVYWRGVSLVWAFSREAQCTAHSALCFGAAHYSRQEVEAYRR